MQDLAKRASLTVKRLCMGINICEKKNAKNICSCDVHMDVKVSTYSSRKEKLI